MPNRVASRGCSTSIVLYAWSNGAASTPSGLENPTTKRLIARMKCYALLSSVVSAFTIQWGNMKAHTVVATAKMSVLDVKTAMLRYLCDEG